MKPKVSFYVPAYNAENTIHKCINSILAQSIQPIEIIVINDCSVDNTLNILLEYNKKIKIINNKKNLGLAKSRNLAIKNSLGDYIASVDADVVCSKHWLKILLKDILKKKLDLIGGKLIELNIETLVNKWRESNMKQNWGNRNILNPDFIAGCNTLLKKKIWNNGIKYDENYKTNGEDVNFSRRLKKNNLSTYYNAKAICYHLQSDNLNSLSQRYWRYNYYGAGIKKITLSRVIKNCIREFKKFLFRVSKHTNYIQYKFIIIDFLVSIKYFILEFKNFINEKKN